MDKMDHFFESVASLMSNLLRGLIENSIFDVVHLLEEYSGGNSYEGEYSLFGPLATPSKIHLVTLFLVRPIFKTLERFHISYSVLQESSSSKEKPFFAPTFDKMCSMFSDIIDAMIRSVSQLARVENFLFQKVDELDVKCLSTICLDPEQVKEAILDDVKERINAVIDANSRGPTRYTSVYKPYQYLLSKDTWRNMEKFITKGNPLRDYVREIEKLKKMASEVASLPVFIPMHLFMLNCEQINAVSRWPIQSFPLFSKRCPHSIWLRGRGPWPTSSSLTWRRRTERSTATSASSMTPSCAPSPPNRQPPQNW
jgi:dynein heavy chain